ncbi:MAG TPA: DUF3098 domain-containing protein [Saprospiraceae bacterium]|jgi:hypothetical protein|nr:DUF3098 domain-containing protein [Saprospiraceae bacterium]
MSQKKKSSTAATQPLKPTTSKVSVETKVEEVVKKATNDKSLVFNRDNFKWMFIGMGVMVLGFILMSGGAMPDSNTWDPSIIYSFRRITLAPIVILIGIGIEIYAIFYVSKERA